MRAAVLTDSWPNFSVIICQIFYPRVSDVSFPSGIVVSSCAAEVKQLIYILLMLVNEGSNLLKS